MSAAQPQANALSVAVYRTLMACSLGVAATALVFFTIGLADGSVSSFNIGLWLALLGGLAAIVWAGHALRGIGKLGLAIAVLAVAAVPGIVGCLFLVLVLVTNSRWN